MALGLPSVNIVFKQEGITAIERGERGIVALVLRDTKALGKHTIYDVSDCPLELSENNKRYVLDASVFERSPETSGISLSTAFNSFLVAYSLGLITLLLLSVRISNVIPYKEYILPDQVPTVFADLIPATVMGSLFFPAPPTHGLS